MEQFPEYVTILFDGYSESFDPSVEVTEMERGPPKMRRINSRVVAALNVRLLFKSSSDAAAFEGWYFDDVNRIDHFTMTHPRTKATITAWFQGGDIGELVPLKTKFSVSARDVVLEYMR